MLQVKYEDLVADAETTCRRYWTFWKYPGIPVSWNTNAAPGTRPLIGTASYNQVTRPLYTEAQGRWRRYRQDEMEPVLPVLAPWISHFGYEG